MEIEGTVEFRWAVEYCVMVSTIRHIVFSWTNRSCLPRYAVVKGTLCQDLGRCANDQRSQEAVLLLIGRSEEFCGRGFHDLDHLPLVI